MPSRDLTDVTLVSEDHDGPDDHDDMIKMKVNTKKIYDDVGYLVTAMFCFYGWVGGWWGVVLAFRLVSALICAQLEYKLTGLAC